MYKPKETYQKFYSKIPAKYVGEKYFLRGPVPFEWLSAVSKAHPQGAKVALVIALLVGLNKGESFHLQSKFLDGVGLSRWTVWRVLNSLEEAKLIVTSRKQGRKARILEVLPPGHLSEGVK